MKEEHPHLSRYLDGELDGKDLPPELRSEAAAFERIMEGLDRSQITVPPTVRTVVMARVRATAEAPWRRFVAWALAPRLSPLGATLVVAAVLAAIWLLPMRRAQPAAPLQSATQSTTRFVFMAPNAERVAITGDWVHWDPDGIPLTSPGKDGSWVAEVVVPPGLHHYVFVVDGREWRPDPDASQVDDGFGQRNSVLFVASQKAS
jgi:hypothetical protein